MNFKGIKQEIYRVGRVLNQQERGYVDNLASEFKRLGERKTPIKFHGPDHTKARRFFLRKVCTLGLQSVHTPYKLCQDIVGKLKEYTGLDDKKICVLFNIEFVEVLIYDFGVKPENIYFFADHEAELVSAVGLY